MKITALDAKFVGSGGAGITRNGQPVPERHGVGVIMNCPCGCEHLLFVPFANPIDGGPNEQTRDGQPCGWQRTGDSIETLTLSPSVQRGEPCPKTWHGHIVNGEAVSC